MTAKKSRIYVSSSLAVLSWLLYLPVALLYLFLLLDLSVTASPWADRYPQTFAKAAASFFYKMNPAFSEESGFFLFFYLIVPFTLLVCLIINAVVGVKLLHKPVRRNPVFWITMTAMIGIVAFLFAPSHALVSFLYPLGMAALILCLSVYLTIDAVRYIGLLCGKKCVQFHEKV